MQKYKRILDLIISRRKIETIWFFSMGFKMLKI